MNMTSIAYILGWILNMEAAFMLLPVCTAVIYGETEGIAFAAVMLLCGAIGYAVTHRRPNNPSFYAR